MSSDNTKPKKLISLVPEGGNHTVIGERLRVFPGVTLEILATRQIELTSWKLMGLNDPFWRLYLPTAGEAEVRIPKDEDESTEVNLRPGNAYLIPPHTTIYSEMHG
ncbi:MAG: hypothetical protein AAF226_16895, partial [Verrucomicrobiota bacterium]